MTGDILKHKRKLSDYDEESSLLAINSNANKKKQLITRCITPPIPHEQAEATFLSLPQELFCKIVAYIGPTSSSLCTLSQVTRDHRAMMTTIGDVMLQRAKMRFRTPLPPKSDCESSISLFVRHARVSKNVHDKLEELEATLKKDFPFYKVSPNNNISRYSSDKLGPSLLNQDLETVKPSEVDHALDISLCLLGAGKEYYGGDMRRAVLAQNAATTVLEWRVSKICGTIGAKAYKYTKARIFGRNEGEGGMFGSYAVSDEMPIEDDYDDERYPIAGLNGPEVAEEINRLEKASLVMQLVVMSDIHAARQIRRISDSVSEHE